MTNHVTPPQKNIIPKTRCTRFLNGSIIESSDLSSNMTVVDSHGVVDFVATIDDEKKLISITIVNPVENETYRARLNQ